MLERLSEEQNLLKPKYWKEGSEEPTMPERWSKVAIEAQILESGF
jgi:hypothetical protein